MRRPGVRRLAYTLAVLVGLVLLVGFDVTSLSTLVGGRASAPATYADSTTTASAVAPHERGDHDPGSQRHGRSLRADATRLVVPTDTGVAAEGAEGGLATAARTCLNSFTGDTPVTMADGTKKPIRDIEIGDEVLATDPETGETAARPVTSLIRHGGKHTMVDVTLSDGSKIRTTDHHPFWDSSTRSFKDAIDLHVGERVLSNDGRTFVISAAKSYDRNLTAYNLQIDGIHTYYAGSTPVLVHNSCVSSADILRDSRALEGLRPSQVDDLARNAGYEVLPGSARAANPATRYYLPGTNRSVGFRVLPSGVAGQSGIKGGAYLKFFGGDLGGLRLWLSAP